MDEVPLPANFPEQVNEMVRQTEDAAQANDMNLVSRCKRFDRAAEHRIRNALSNLLQVSYAGAYRIMEKRTRRGARRELLELRNCIDFLTQRPLRQFLEF